nr:MAG TPA: hypothetical protein [Caudoviricetes sp.]
MYHILQTLCYFLALYFPPLAKLFDNLVFRQLVGCLFLFMRWLS